MPDPFSVITDHVKRHENSCVKRSRKFIYFFTECAGEIKLTDEI